MFVRVLCKKYGIDVILMFLVGSLFLTCKSGKSEETKGLSIEILSSEQFYNALTSEENPQLIDVRTHQEFESGHLISSRNINIHDPNFIQLATTLDKEKTTFVYCGSGMRSAKASRILDSIGFIKIYDLEGGYKNWKY